MRVALWTGAGPGGGSAAYTSALAAALRELGLEADVVPIPPPGGDGEAALGCLNAADVVHLQHEYAFFGGIAPRASTLPFYLRRLRPPLVLTAHTVRTAAELLRVDREERPRQRLAKRLLASYPPYRDYLERGPFREAARLIVHTEEARGKLAGRGIEPQRIHVLPPGIPEVPAGDPADAEALRARLGLRAGRVLALPGGPGPETGWKTALEALKSLPPAVQLLVLGEEHEPGCLEQLRAEIRGCGLDERVRIAGDLDAPVMAAAMGLADLVLAPHHSESGLYPVMIAIGCGKPVLASDLACFREVREQGAGIELFDTGDERMLAERIGFLLASSVTRVRMEAESHEFAARRTWGAVAAETARVYRLAGPGC